MILIIIFAVQFRRTRNKSTPVVNEPTTDCTIQFGSAKRNGDIDWNITESGKTLAPIILNATIYILYVGHKSERKQSEE